MTQIVVSKRDGIVRAPDGTRHRVHRGKTLADATHPVVVAYPNDWTPMHVELAVPGGESPGTQHEQVAQLENDVAELEETNGMLVASLTAVSELLDQHGELPPIDERGDGWLVEAVRTTLANAYGRGRNDATGRTPAPEPDDVQAPRAPRAVKRAAKS